MPLEIRCERFALVPCKCREGPETKTGTGAMGQVIAIDLADDNQQVQRLTIKLHGVSDDDQEGVVRITPVEFTEHMPCKTHNFGPLVQLTQFPVRLAYAMTIHTLQVRDLLLPNAVNFAGRGSPFAAQWW